jgi:hypothetical protein
MTKQNPERRGALAICPFQCRANIEKARLLCRWIGDQRPQSLHQTLFSHVRSQGRHSTFAMTHDDGCVTKPRHGLGKVAISVF